MSMTPGPSYMNGFLVNESISIMFVALGMSMIGFGFARVGGTEFMKLHRWALSGAIILTMLATLFVMFPSLLIYYSDSSNSVTSPFSILQLFHSVEGFPAIVSSMVYLTNDLPHRTKRWMRTTAILWLVAIASGALVYYTMPS